MSNTDGANQADEFWWLIERGQPEGETNPVWWLGQPWEIAFGAGAWTDDANEAMKFTTKEEAESEHSDYPEHARGRAVRHGWFASASGFTEGEAPDG